MKPAPIAFAPPGRPLAHFRFTRAEVEAAFGPPQYEPGGPRSLPAWGLALECGLVIELQLDEAAGVGLLHAEPRELPHALWHFGFADRLVWRADRDDDEWLRALEEYHPLSWGRWTVVDRTTGARATCLSPQEARCRLAAHPEAQQETMHIEEAPLSEARQRRRSLLDAVKRRTRGVAHPRFEVWVVHAEGAESLVELFASRSDAERHAEGLSVPSAARAEVRARE